MTADITPTPADRGLLTIPEGVPWRMLEETPWREGACKDMHVSYEVARHVFIAMRPPRSVKRCKDELDYLGFTDPTGQKGAIAASTIRNWSIKGDWNRDARLHDMGRCTIEELQRRVAGLRDAALMPLVDSLAEVMMAAMQADRIEQAIEKAADKGDIKGIMDAAKTAAELIGYVTGSAQQADALPPPQVHQHLHAHVDGAGDVPPPTPGGALSRVLTPFSRTLDRLDAAAAEKRAKGTAKTNGAKPNGANGSNGHAKTINGNGEDPED